MKVRTFLRLNWLQQRCWNHGHRAWAKAIGQRIREARQDHPELRRYA